MLPCAKDSRYIIAAMKHKPITFRCTHRQWERLLTAVSLSPGAETRTAVISDALTEFLDYVEHGEGAGLDLFQLVTKIDTSGSREKFGEQA